MIDQLTSLTTTLSPQLKCSHSIPRQPPSPESKESMKSMVAEAIRRMNDSAD